MSADNATIFGDGGHDTFVFKPAFGSATIADFDVNNDTIEISQGHVRELCGRTLRTPIRSIPIRI